jgi:vitamin B12 transporter
MPGKYYNRQGSKQDPKMEDLVDTQNVAFFAGFGGKIFSWSAGLSANRAANHFIFENTYGTTWRRENNDVYDTAASTSFAWFLNDQTRMILNSSIYYGDKSIPGPMFSLNIGKQKDLSIRQNFLLDMPQIGSDKLSTEASLDYSWSSLDYADQVSDSLHRLNTLTAINRWNWYPLSALTLKFAGDYRYNNIDSTNIGMKGSHEGGLSAAAEYSLNKKFLFVPSLKIIFSGTNLVPIPKLGLVWYAADTLTIKNNYFRSFKFPSFNDRYWSGDSMGRGNPGLKSEDGIGADLIVEYGMKNWFNLESSIYTEWMQDSIHWRSVAGVWEPRNIGEAAFFGWDARITSSFSDTVILSIFYQYLLTYILTGNLDFADNIRMPYMPMHSGGASAEFRWSIDPRGTGSSGGNKGSILISGHYESLRYTETLNINRLEPHFLLNLNVNQEIGKKFTTFAVLRNVLNVHYFSVEDYPMPGITLTLGIRINAELTGKNATNNNKEVHYAE